MSGELNGGGFGFPVTLAWRYDNFELQEKNAQILSTNKFTYVVPDGYTLFVVGSQISAGAPEWLSAGSVTSSMKNVLNGAEITNFPVVTAIYGSAATNNASRFVSSGACSVPSGTLVTVYLNTSVDFDGSNDGMVATCLVYGYLRPA